ncbi:ISLho1 transposase [Paucilactobacillus hokkaidonensis JCM 18461]|uniref:ISLho1 transposase n=1 Tax=Paucilactobacillus hokkaidonensis JCM 18461 TaxID=1291742 RepID=A0A0A1GZD9_9LACO|nr:ISLre2-like element ISLho1 family transposase [Paucilactobacillus hokkaidonensis]BAP85836.1 ISLho1 transposase [Paucilactobacillus hokkaidonensis JCM 18461]
MFILADFIDSLKNLDSLFDLEEQVIRCLREMFQEIVSKYLIQLDETLVSQIPSDHTFINRQPRTINFMFGAVSFERRCYRKTDGTNYFPLDTHLKLASRKRFSPYFKSVVSKIGQMTTMRNTADMINLASQTDISAWAVDKIVREMADIVAVEEETLDKEIVHRKKVDNLVIEGDAFEVRERGKQRVSVHHYKVYESTNAGPVNKREFVETNHLKARKQVCDYLEAHYKLSEMVVFLASDAAPGYDPISMRELVPGAKKVEYVIDRYHFIRKFEQTIGLQNPLSRKATAAIRGHNLNQLEAILDTFESQITTGKDSEKLIKLRHYLSRNWKYIKRPKDRGYKYMGKLGSVESSHRAFTYRLKKQGKSWSKEGLQAMLVLILARVNRHLNQDLSSGLRRLRELKIEVSLESIKSIRFTDLNRKTRSHHIGVKIGNITVDSSTSSPIGAMAKAYSR